MSGPISEQSNAKSWKSRLMHSPESSQEIAWHVARTTPKPSIELTSNGLRSLDAAHVKR